MLTKNKSIIIDLHDFILNDITNLINNYFEIT